MPQTIHAFFNVSGSVGKNAANIDLDVMLVQYMLWNIMVQGAPHFTNLRTWENYFLPKLRVHSFRASGLKPYTPSMVSIKKNWIPGY